MSGTAADLDIREYREADEPAVLELLQASLGWVPDEQYGRFFAWKHRENPAGNSPAWVAVDGDRIAGFRIFLRWEFLLDGRVVRAVRAVDTATHPDYQGRGIFSRLTLHAIDALRAEGVAFVFNTPNDSSRPGYLKMGWQPVARLPVLMRPRSVGALIRVVRARVPAEKWSTPTEAGLPALDVLSDRVAVDALLTASATDGAGLQTHRTPEFMAWRYGFAPLAYRVLLAGDRPSDGFVVFRLRRRGAAMEAAIADVVLPASIGSTGALLRQLLRESGADYAVRIGGATVARAGSLTVPGQGPTLVWREVSDPVMPAPEAWHLTLGDVELF